MRCSLPATAALLLAMVFSPAALAAPPQGTGGGPAAPGDVDDATRAEARKIAEEGLALFDAGRYADALDRFQRAGALVRAPTMELLSARSLVKLGRLVEASDHYRTAAEMTLTDGASEALRKARVDAAKEREALVPRIPSLWLSLEGTADGASVTLDGERVAQERIGAAFPIDPGPHAVVVTLGATSKTERFQLTEGEQRRLALSLDAPPPPPAASPLRIAGFVGIALGGVGVIVGAVAGGVSVSTSSELDQVCKPSCPESERDKVATYETTKAITTPSLVAGAVLLGAGGLLVGLAPSSPQSTGGARVTPWLGAGSAGLRVVF